MTDDPSLDGRTGVPRRTFLAAGGAAGLAGVAGCTGFFEDRAAADATIMTVPVESDVDGEFYHPTQEHIESGVYSPLTRPLFIYVNHASLEEKPDTLGLYVKHYFEGQHDFARQTGYYATDDATREANQEAFQAVLDDLGIDPDPAGADGDRYPEIDVVYVGEETLAMIEAAMRAYATDDAAACRDVAAMDDEVDALCERASQIVLRDLLERATVDLESAETGDDHLAPDPDDAFATDPDDHLAPEPLEDVSRLLLTIRDLERVGDHAVNVAARTLYMVDNDDGLIY